MTRHTGVKQLLTSMHQAGQAAPEALWLSQLTAAFDIYEFVMSRLTVCPEGVSKFLIGQSGKSGLPQTVHSRR